MHFAQQEQPLDLILDHLKHRILCHLPHYVRKPTIKQLHLMADDIIAVEMIEAMRVFLTKTVDDLTEMAPHRITITNAHNDSARKAALLRTRCMEQCVRDTLKVPLGDLHKQFKELIVPTTQANYPWRHHFSDNGRMLTSVFYAAIQPRVLEVLRVARTDVRRLFAKAISNDYVLGWRSADVVVDISNPNVPTHPDVDRLREFVQIVRDRRSFDYSPRNHSVPGKDAASKQLSIVLWRFETDPMTPNVQRLVLRKYEHTHENDWSVTRNKKTDMPRLDVRLVHTDFVVLDNVPVSRAVFDRTTWTLTQLFAEVPDVEHRRVLLLRYGYDKLITKDNSKVLDMDVATIHAGDNTAVSITRALIELAETVENRTLRLRLVVGTDGSTGRVYYMPASRRENDHCDSLKEWDMAVGQPESLYAQA